MLTEQHFMYPKLDVRCGSTFLGNPPTSRVRPGCAQPGLPAIQQVTSGMVDGGRRFSTPAPRRVEWGLPVMRSELPLHHPGEALTHPHDLHCGPLLPAAVGMPRSLRMAADRFAENASSSVMGRYFPLGGGTCERGVF
jgi:hypothetical protein